MAQKTISTGTAIVVLFITLGCVFGFGALLSYQYESNCTYSPATKESSCTERRAWNGSGAVQALSALAGTGAGGAAAIWLPKILKKFLGSPDDSEAG